MKAFLVHGKLLQKMLNMVYITTGLIKRKVEFGGLKKRKRQ
jgi:hypothetical protein